MGEQNKRTDESVEKDQAQEYLELLQRLQAEFSNYKKRIERDKRELSTKIKGKLIQDLLPVLDDFERMLSSPSQDDGKLSEGARLIYEKLLGILKKEGLEPFSAQGKDFDPSLHEAVSVTESPPELDGKVIEEWQRGYLFKGELLRPARVKVGRFQRN